MDVPLFAILLRILWKRVSSPELFSWRRTLTDILHVSIGGLLIRAGFLAVIGLIFTLTGSLGLGQSMPLWLQVAIIMPTATFGQTLYATVKAVGATVSCRCDRWFCLRQPKFLRASIT